VSAYTVPPKRRSRTAHLHGVKPRCFSKSRHAVDAEKIEPHKYDLSKHIYEHKLGPHLREMHSQRLVVADGFDCKTQIEQATGRPHLAQLLQIARHGDDALDYHSERFGDEEATDNSKLIGNGAPLLGLPQCRARSWYLAPRIFR